MTDRMNRLIQALQPLAAIADAYEKSGLDEHRPGWGDKPFSDVEIVSGRGGKRLLTLQHAFDAREALKGVQDQSVPARAILEPVWDKDQMERLAIHFESMEPITSFYAGDIADHIRNLAKSSPATERRIPNPTLTPGHTDLMLSPESIDVFLDQNPPPITDQSTPKPKGYLYDDDRWEK